MSQWSGILSEARALVAAGQAARARELLSRLVAIDDPGGAAAAAGLLIQLGDLAGAAALAAAALARHGDHVELLRAHGAALIMSGRGAEAVDGLKRLKEIAPRDPEVVLMLGQSLLESKRYLEGRALCLEALQAWPQLPPLLVQAYNVHQALYDDDAWRYLTPLMGSFGGRPEVCCALAVAASFSGSASPREIFEFHAAFGRALERQRPGEGVVSVPDPDPERRLRVAVVAYDFQSNSSVGFFLRPLFEHLDRAAFTLVGVHTGETVDEGTSWFRSRAAEWRQLPPLDVAALAAQIRQDRIDIAIEINSHAGQLGKGPRNLPAFQPRVAPVQVSYLGYSNTTGMRSFDWRIVDSITDPPPQADALATERLWRLDPCFLCYAPNPDIPAVAPIPPRVSNGYPTFGVLCLDIYKINPGLLAAWGRVLGAVPGSRLLFKSRAADNPGVEEYLRERMAAAGLDVGRVEFLRRTPTFNGHLEVYNRVDVVLDTFPYGGTTTICEALSMGVPVVALHPAANHDRHAARVPLSILHCVGLAELIGRDQVEYVRRAAELAQDSARLAHYRASLRQKLMTSCLCDGPAFGRRVGLALREMWKQRCRGRTDHAIPEP